MPKKDTILVGDVGGTHARFAIVDASGPAPWRIEARVDIADQIPTFGAVLRTYIERSGISELPSTAVIAVAGPVAAGAVEFTNRQWEISELALRDFGFGKALLINDFVALAYAVDVLSDSDA